MTATLEGSARLFPWICVREPYFALEHVKELGTNGLEAELPVQQPLGMEAAPISAAETGRHLAILGLCAISRLNPRRERHYYLAHEAEARRHCPELRLDPRERLVGRARAEYEGGRQARASAEVVTRSGLKVYSLEVSYHVLHEKTFARLFKSFQCEEPPPAAGSHPYERSVPLREVEYTGERLVCELERIRPEQCVGHFAGFPALPVAILASVLNGTAGRLLSHRRGAEPVRYLVVHSRIQAERLAFAGEKPLIEARYLGSSGKDHQFACAATAEDGQLLARMVVELQQVE